MSTTTVMSTTQSNATILDAVNTFRNQRESEERYLYYVVELIAGWLTSVGLTFTFIIGILKTSGPHPALNAVSVFSTGLIGAGIMTIITCDPERTNINEMLRKKPLLRATIGFAACAYQLHLASKGYFLATLTSVLCLCMAFHAKVLEISALTITFAPLSPLITRASWNQLQRGHPPWASHGLLMFLIMLWYWCRKIVCRAVTPAEATQAYYTILHMYLFAGSLTRFSTGIEEWLAEGSTREELAEMWEDLITGLFWFIPPVLLVTKGRRWWYTYFHRRFNGNRDRYMRDAGFIAQLLDSVQVTEGDVWWQLRESADHQWPATDHRHHFRKGKIILVESDAFSVRFPAVHGRSPEIAVFPMARRNTQLDELVESASAQLRCMEWTNLTLELLSSGPVCGSDDPMLSGNRFLEASRPVQPSERIDFFLSHCWHDSASAKYMALSDVAEGFKRRHGRYPTFWFDKTCIDQNYLGDGLRVLPLTVMSCNQLLMLFTPKYSQRLWCVWELFTIMAFHPLEQALKRIMPVILEQEFQCASAASDPYVALCAFTACDASCFDPNDEHRLRKVIAAVGEEDFNLRIQELGKFCREQQAKSPPFLASPTSFAFPEISPKGFASGVEGFIRQVTPTVFTGTSAGMCAHSGMSAPEVGNDFPAPRHVIRV